MDEGQLNDSISLDIAVIGMAGRFPGASNLDKFWQNLKNGVESVTFFSDDELLKAGVEKDLLSNPNYVKAAPVLEDIEAFDAQFFNFSPGEAQLLDPQRRLFLECGWHALENAGYDPDRYDGAIGVYAGAGFNGYLIYNLARSSRLGKDFDEQQVLISSDKDHLPTHLSYKLNLTGPSVNVNTACSSSLVAIHLARQALFLGECDMALAGGSSVTVPHHAGYLYRRDSILSPDGHCRAFDAKAQGTIWGSGCGVVVLKTLDAALADGDQIHAVIKGSAINNDGADKVGFTAPSVDGQTNVVLEALAASGVSADSVTYVESHGTGTSLGDPIEIEALTQAYRSETDEIGYCAVGSIKPNIGHLGAAAGVASFIKTVLALKHRQIPPSINFDQPNPKINFDSSPFFVNTRLVSWEGNRLPRRAGVSSLAVGGTNAHVILQEAPSDDRKQSVETGNAKEVFILPISTRTASSLDRALDNLALHLDANPDLSLHDIAYTLQEGRKAFRHRAAVRCHSLDEARRGLQQRDKRYLLTAADAGALSGSASDKLLSIWLGGDEVDWSGARNGHAHRRTSLPVYPFHHQKFWVNADTAQHVASDDERVFGKLDSISKMLSTPSFKHVPLPLPETGGEAYQPKTRWIFLGANELGLDVAKQLAVLGDDLIYIKMGGDFLQLDKNTFTVNPALPETYVKLARKLKAMGKIPQNILHFWNVAAPAALPKPPSRLQAAIQRRMFTPGLVSDFIQRPGVVKLFENWYKFIGEEIPGHPVMDFSKSMNPSFFSMLWLIQALIGENYLDQLELVFFASGLFDITGHEELDPTRNTLLSLSIVAQQEYLNLKCRVVDVPLTSPSTFAYAQLVDQLEADVLRSPDDQVSAYRSKRMVRYYQPIPVADDAPRQKPIKRGGLYLVHNGLIGVGKELTRYMLESCGAKVLLTADFFFPEEKDWDAWFKDKNNDPEGPIGFRIQGIQELQQLGAEFLGPLSPMCDRKKMLKRISSYEKQYGPVRGIMHSAGANVTGLMQFIGAMDRQTSAYHIGFIAYSLVVLDDLFRNHDLDFRVVTSSLGSVLGAQAAANYGAASSFNAAFTTAFNRTEATPWRIHNWDTVDAEWETVETELKTIVDLVKGRLEEGVLNVKESIDIFERTFALDRIDQVIICSNDLDARYDRWVRMKDFRTESGEVRKLHVDLHPRPELDVDYVAPRDELEEKVAGAFSRVLGLDRIGIHDDFSELGGHSLLATQLATDIRELFQRDIGMMPILESPTVAGLADYMREQEAQEQAAGAGVA